MNNQTFTGRPTIKEAKEQGFIVDECCNPPIAYKGPRFRPTEHCECLTEREELMLTELESVLGWLEWLVTPFDAKDGMHAAHIKSVKKTIKKVRGL